MKSKNITCLFMAIIAATTVFGWFTQPTVVHQVAVWAGGLFSLALIGLVFLVRNWPETATKSEAANNIKIKKPEQMTPSSKDMVLKMRLTGWSDQGIADATGFDIEMVKAVK